MQNFSVVAEIRKGFARRGPLGFGDGDSQGFPTLTLRAWGWKRRSLGIVIFCSLPCCSRIKTARIQFSCR